MYRPIIIKTITDNSARAQEFHHDDFLFRPAGVKMSVSRSDCNPHTTLNQ